MNRMTQWNENRKRYEVVIGDEVHSGSITDKLAEYENAEEQELSIKLPPDGQIYHIEESIETNERWIGNKPCRFITSEGYHCGWGIGTVCFKFVELGKTVFLTREEAEKAWHELTIAE
jgi:hypothetical protein